MGEEVRPAAAGGESPVEAGEAAGRDLVPVPAAAATGAGYQIATTMPDELIRHNISDEELDVLCDPPRDEMRELKWAALGSFLTALPVAGDALLGYSPDEPLGRLALLNIVVMFVALAVWLVLRFVVKRRSRTSYDKRDEIRARTRRIREGMTNGTQ